VTLVRVDYGSMTRLAHFDGLPASCGWSLGWFAFVFVQGKRPKPLFGRIFQRAKLSTWLEKAPALRAMRRRLSHDILAKLSLNA
jgi:hypothetical protein